MTEVLFTGFEAFDGRSVNASWIAASGIVTALADPAVTALQLPVVWDRPGPVLLRRVDLDRPNVVIALGEGKPGCIQFETLASNRRIARTDNAGCLPENHAIDVTGPASLPLRAPLAEIRNGMVRRGFPSLLSLDAGGFLCEEVLYQLVRSLESRPFVQLALFVHLPPFGTRLLAQGEEKTCDEAFLLDFAYAILAEINLIMAGLTRPAQADTVSPS